MEDTRTIKIYFPEAMGAAAALVGSYDITSDSAGATSLAPAKFEVTLNTAGTIATLKLSADLATSTNYYLDIDQAVISNATGTKFVSDGAATPDAKVAIFGLSATAAAKPSIKSVTLDDNRMGMTVTMDMDVAFFTTATATTGNLTVANGSADANLADNAFMDSTDAAALFTLADFNDVFTIKGQLVGDAAQVTVVASAVTRNSNSSSFHVAFATALKPSTEGYVTTENADTSLYMFNTAHIAAGKTAATDSKVTFGVPATAAYDVTVPALVSATYLDADGNGEIDALEFVFTEAINASTVALTDFVFSAESVIDSSNIDAADVTVASNKITIVIDADVAADDLTFAADEFAWAANAFTDLAGNNIAIQGAGTMTDGAAPVILTAVNSAATFTLNDVISITFSEPIAMDEDAIGNFTATTAGAGTIKADAGAVDNNVATIQINDATWANGDSIAVGLIVDAAANALNATANVITFTDVTDANTAAKNTID